MAAPAPPPQPNQRTYDVVVSGRGIANRQAKLPNAMCKFGPDTPGTRTSGIQEALDFLKKAKTPPGCRTPEGGRIFVKGDAVLHQTLEIPIWPGLSFEAEHITVEIPSGDGILIGHDYAQLGDIIIGGSQIRIGTLDGPMQGNRGGSSGLPAYHPDGVTGLHVNQLDGGRLDIGMVRFFTRYGIYLDGYDEKDAHAACIDNIILVDAMTSNGVGLRTRSNSSPQGSFTGGNKITLGHLLGNFFGILLDADTDGNGVLTRTQPTSINNHISATVEDSTSLRRDPAPQEACDVYINGDSNLLFLNAKVVRLRGDQNFLVVPGTESFHRYDPSDRNVVMAPSLRPTGFANLPANPPVPGQIYQNPLSSPLDIYVPVTFRGAGSFQPSLGQDRNQMVQLPAELTPQGTPPGSSRTFLLRVPPGWYYSFSTVQATLGFALGVPG